MCLHAVLMEPNPVLCAGLSPCTFYSTALAYPSRSHQCGRYVLHCLCLSVLSSWIFLSYWLIATFPEPMILLESKEYLRNMLCSLPILASLQPVLCSLGPYPSASPWGLCSSLLSLSRNRNRSYCVCFVLPPL